MTGKKEKYFFRICELNLLTWIKVRESEVRDEMVGTINRRRLDRDAIRYRVCKLIIEYEVVEKLNIKLYRGSDYQRTTIRGG